MSKIADVVLPTSGWNRAQRHPNVRAGDRGATQTNTSASTAATTPSETCNEQTAAAEARTNGTEKNRRPMTELLAATTITYPTYASTPHASMNHSSACDRIAT